MSKKPSAPEAFFFLVVNILYPGSTKSLEAWWIRLQFLLLGKAPACLPLVMHSAAQLSTFAKGMHWMGSLPSAGCLAKQLSPVLSTSHLLLLIKQLHALFSEYQRQLFFFFLPPSPSVPPKGDPLSQNTVLSADSPQFFPSFSTPLPYR